MTISRRNRREWRIILWISLASAVISAYFGQAVAPADDPPLMGVLQGILTSLLIATPIAFFEVRRARISSLGWMRRLPLLALQLLYREVSESMGNHDSEIVDAGSVD